MDFEVVMQSLLALVRHTSIAIVVYACVVCLLTQVVKKLFIPKLKIDLLNKFDPTIIVPFVLGCACAVFHALVISKNNLAAVGVINDVLISGLTIGATSTVVYRLLSAFSGNNVKKLCKDDIFNLFYIEMFVYSDVKKKLLDGQITMQSFVSEVKVVSAKASNIYQDANMTSEQKQQKLIVLMRGLISDDMITKIVTPMHNALLQIFSKVEIVSKG